MGFVKVYFGGLVHVAKETFRPKTGPLKVGDRFSFSRTVCLTFAEPGPSMTETVFVTDQPVTCLACLADMEHGL